MRKCQITFQKWAILVSGRLVLISAVFLSAASTSGLSAAGAEATSLCPPKGCATARATPITNSTLNPVQLTSLEESIASADLKELNILEVKISRFMQNNPNDVAVNYLMSLLLLKMFTFDPGSYSLIRQSTELASQTYDLDVTSELGITALASILEVSGEAERGIALLAEASRTGMHFGWRANLAKARLLSFMANDRNADEILSILGEVLKDKGVSHKLVAPILADVLELQFGDQQGPMKIEELQAWSHRCPSKEMSLELSRALRRDSRQVEAYAEYAKLLVTSPNNAEALIGQGMISEVRHDYKTAILKYRAGAASSENSSQQSSAKIYLAGALIHQNTNHAAANLAAIDAVTSSSDQEGALLNILAAYRKSGSKTVMRAFIERVVDEIPSLSMGHALLGELLGERSNRLKEASISFTNAIALDQRRGEYYNGRGLVLMGLQDLDSALDDFEKASNFNPEDASARYNIACAQARLGLKDEALLSLRSSFEMDIRLQAIAKSDADLASIRSMPGFDSLVNLDLTSGKKTISVGH